VNGEVQEAPEARGHLFDWVLPTRKKRVALKRAPHWIEREPSGLAWHRAGAGRGKPLPYSV
jgi:hypothetical protein